MGYKDLPLEQRMELASQYALLLVADNKPKEEIIALLKSDYELTELLATQAYANMRSNYKSEYESTIRSNIYKGLGAAGFSLFAFLCYYFLGKEMGNIGFIPLILAVFFGFGGIISLILTANTIWERYGKAKKADHIDGLLYMLICCGSLVLLLFAYEYFFEVDILDVHKIVTVENCIIAEPVDHRRAGGKSPSYYYALKVKGHNIECRFFDKYYKYSNKAWLISELKEGDTVSLQLTDDYLNYFQDQNSTGDLNIVNLGRHGRFLIDHTSRNAQISKAHKTNFYVFLAAFAGVIILLFLKNVYHLIQNSRQTGV